MATGTVILNCARMQDPSVAAIEYLARLKLGLRRGGRELCLASPSPELAELIDLAGLAGVLGCDRKPSARDSAIQVAQIRVKRRAAERAHPSMRERAAQKLNPKMGRMGAEDPPRGFRSRPLLEVKRQPEQREEPCRVEEEGELADPPL
ncbi:MAG: STAS domain-containing protein [Chloroflexi bacterium]|nr:MAG: STAS domain-containing protein [Chloroflexota bacterium]TME04262.1 MAG: STAS domain-containing protein [Chloroflexota bacterium]